MYLIFDLIYHFNFLHTYVLFYRATFLNSNSWFFMVLHENGLSAKKSETKKWQNGCLSRRELFCNFFGGCMHVHKNRH